MSTMITDAFPLGVGAEPIRDDQPTDWRPWGMRRGVQPQGGHAIPADLVFDHDLQVLTRDGEVWAAKGDPTATFPPTYRDGQTPNTPADFEKDSDTEN